LHGTYLPGQGGEWHLVWSVGSELVGSAEGKHCGGVGGGGGWWWMVVVVVVGCRDQREALVVVD